MGPHCIRMIGILKVELEKAVAECERLREENARLKRRDGQAPVTRASRVEQASAHNPEKRDRKKTVVGSLHYCRYVYARIRRVR